MPKKMIFILLLFFSQILFFSIVAEAKDDEAGNDDEIFQKELKKLKETVSTPGTYAIYLNYHHDGEKLEKKVYVTITGEKTIIKGYVAIDAEDVYLTIDQLNEMTQEDWIRRAQARAWQTDDGATLPIIHVDDSAVQKEFGSYSLIFQTINRVSTTVQVTIGTHQDRQADFENNQKNGWFEWYGLENNLSWNAHEKMFKMVIQLSLIIFLLLPIIILIIQYFLTTNIVKKIIQTMIQNLQ